MALTGLAALAEISNSQTSGGGDFEKVPWMKLEDGQSVRFRFLQEIDSDSKFYNEKHGEIKVLMEHTSPTNWKIKMQCTADIEGRCFACEQHKVDPKAGWKARPRLYASVLVKNEETGVTEVQIMSQGVGAKSITPALLELAKEDGPITNRSFKITRHGVKKDTSYTLIGLAPVAEGYDDMDEYESPDLEAVCTRTIPYEDQAAFFNGGAVQPEAESAGGWAKPDAKDALSGW